MFSNELQHKQSIVETNKGIWVSREILQMDLTPSEKLVYALLCQLSQMEKQAAYITNKQVSQITGIAETTVKNKIKPELRKLGLLQTVGIYNDVKHLKGDTKGMHLKGDTKGTPQDMHLKGDGDMHLKGDRGCTQKVTQNNNEILQENIKVTYYTSDSHQSDSDAINNLTSNLELYVEDNTPDVPEWMNELPVTEPFVQYTDDIQGEAMQETNNNTFQADERENDPDPVTGKVNKITSSDEGIDGENALNGLKVALGVSPTDIYDEETENDLSQADENDPDEPQENETSLNAVLSDERDDGGTTTHRQAESLPNGEKTTPMGVTDPVTDNVNNNLNNDNFNMTVQERKEKQTELSRKWENFKEQVPQMHRADAEMYFSRFLSKVEQYYTGKHIPITQERFTREFNDLKPLADWNEEQAKQDIENWISQGFNPDTLKRYVRQKYGEAHDEFVMEKWREHHSKPIELNPEYVKNPNAPYVLPF